MSYKCTTRIFAPGRRYLRDKGRFFAVFRGKVTARDEDGPRSKRSSNGKFEILIPKSETNSPPRRIRKGGEIQTRKMGEKFLFSAFYSWFYFSFWICFVFRISIFGFASLRPFRVSSSVSLFHGRKIFCLTI